MIRILLIDDNEDLLEVLTVLLSLEAKFDIVAANGVQEALKHLNERDDIDGIICDYQMVDGTGGEVFTLNKSKKNLPFALFTVHFLDDCDGMENFREQNKLNRYIRKAVDEAKLFDYILDIERSKNTQADRDVAHDMGFHRLPISFLKRFKFKNIDYYVRLKEDHFVKISNAGESVQGELESYEVKGVHFLFVKIEDLGKLFVEIKDLITLAKTKSETFEDEVVSISGIQFEISLLALKHLGLKREHIDFINNSLSNTLTKLSKHQELKTIFDKLNQNDGTYKNHSLLSLYLATPMIYALGWQSPSTVERIVHAALFHDSALTNQHLVDYENGELNSPVLKPQDEKELRAHPVAAATMLKKFEFIHLETIKIIQEHHERPDGKGYPAGLSATHVSALGAAFIIAHDFALELIKNKYDMNAFKFYLASKKNYYSAGQFKRCFEAFATTASKL